MTSASHATSLAVTCAPTDNTIVQSPNDKRYYKVIRLKNDLQVLLISDPDLKNSAVSLSVAVGSIDNPNSQLGLAHYLEHMLFLGSKRYPVINEYSKFMSHNGGYTNAYTAQNKTVFGFEINDNAFNEALDRLGDVMHEPLLDKKYADKERHTVNAENQTYFDNDMRKLYALERYTLNPSYPSARFSTGNLTTLADKPGSILQKKLESFFTTYYSANVMKVALTSPRSIHKLTKLAQKYLSQIPNRNTHKTIILTPMVTPAQLAIKVEMKPTANIKLLQVDFLVPTIKDEYMYQAGHYLSRLLGSDHKGGLSDTLKAQGLATMVMSGFYNNDSQQYSKFTIQFRLTDKGIKDQNAILATLYAYIDLIKKEGINKIQYDALKVNLDTTFKYLTKQSGFNYVMYLSAAMQDYPVKDILFFPYRLDAFKKKFITQLAYYLTPSNSRMFELSPKAKGRTQIPYYNGKYSVNKISQKQQAKWLREAKKIKLVLPMKNKWVTADHKLIKKTHKDLAVKLIDKKGNSVWFQNSAYLDQPKASISVQLNSDIADTSAKSRATMCLLLNMIAKQFAALNFVTHEAGMNFSINSKDGLLFSTAGYSDKQIDLMLTVLTSTKKAIFTHQSLALAKSDIIRQINNKPKGSALNYTMSGLSKLMLKPAWSDKTMIDEIKRIKISDIDIFKTQIFDDSSLRILALGNLSQKQVIKLNSEVRKIVKVNKKPFYLTPFIQANSDQGGINYQLKSQMKDDALAVLYLDKQKTFKARATAELLNQLLKPAFYNQIRTQEQLTYSPFSMSFSVDKQVGFGLFTQTPVVSNAELYTRFNSFLTKFKTTLNTFNQAKFNEIKHATIANYLAKPTSLAAEFTFLSGQWSLINKNINRRKEYINALSMVSLNDIKAFYNQVIIEKKESQLIIIQVQGTRFKNTPLLKVKGEISISNIENLNN
ncbi:MAG: insulinase family protein [Psychromonas sp.]|nr:insulinase family protein [Psychromonas sp.]